MQKLPIDRIASSARLRAGRFLCSGFGLLGKSYLDCIILVVRWIFRDNLIESDENQNCATPLSSLGSRRILPGRQVCRE
jgi:hypothetical protein